jgi:MFS family permease
VTQEPIAEVGEAAERVAVAEKERRSWVIDTRPLRRTAYRRMWVGNGVSYFGFQFTSVAVPVEMYAITNSSAWVGLLGVAGLVPLLIFGLWGGAAADVVDRRRLLLASSTLAWTATVGFLVQALIGLDNPLLLLALTAVQSAGFAISSPARQAIIPRIVRAISCRRRTRSPTRPPPRVACWARWRPG